MTWLFTDGTIPHLEHAWMPQKDGIREAYQFALEGIEQTLSLYHQVNLTLFEATRKVDDAMSMLVRKCNGTMFAAYKAKNPVWYHKGYKGDNEKLGIVIDHLEELFEGEDNVEYQIGFMAYHPEGLPPMIKPNVVAYDLPGVIGQKLAIVLVSRTELDESANVVSFSFNTNKKYHVGRENTENIYFYQNRLGHDGIRYTELQLLCHPISVEMSSIWAFFYFLDERNAWSRIDVCDELQIFLNSKNREEEAWDMSSVWREYVDFLEERFEKKRGTYKTLSGLNAAENRFSEKLMEIHNYRYLYEVLFEMVWRIRKVSEWMVYDTCPAGSEGIVIHLNTVPGVVAFKLVDPSFTRANHEKWNPE